MSGCPASRDAGCYTSQAKPRQYRVCRRCAVKRRWRRRADRQRLPAVVVLLLRRLRASNLVKKRRKAICDDEDGAPMHGTPDTSARAAHPFMHAEGDGASDVPHPPAQMLPKPVRKRTVVLSVKDWCEWHDRICGATACSDAGHTLRDEVARA